MATTATSVQTSSSGSLTKATIAILGAGAAFFILTDVYKYFLWNEDAYGYYWQFRLSLILHVTGGLVALVAGVFQLWSGSFRSAMGVHPWTGRLYVAGIVLGSIGGSVLGVTSAVYGFAWSVGIFGLVFAWLATTGVALHCIRRRNVVAHKEWMIRSYIVTFGFVTFRMVVDYVPYESAWGVVRADMATAMIWTAWVIPLLVYQIRLQYKKA